jgi:hypothetical protein
MLRLLGGNSPSHEHGAKLREPPFLAFDDLSLSSMVLLALGVVRKCKGNYQ